MQLRLVAEEKPSTPWDVAVSLLGEPVQVGRAGASPDSSTVAGRQIFSSMSHVPCTD